MPLLFRRRCLPEHPFINAGLTTRSRLSRWTAPSIVNTSPAWLVPIRMMPEMLAEELRKFPPRRCFILARCRSFLSASLREQGFRTARKDDPREVHFLYANSYEREAAAQLFEKNGWKRIRCRRRCFHNVVCVVARGDGCHATSRW